jgi:hypothetical protein
MIKYAIFTVRSDNIGDNAQAYAVHTLLTMYMSIPDKDIIFFSYGDVLQKIESDVVYVTPLVTADMLCHNFIDYLSSKGLCGQFIFIPLSLGQTRWTFVDEKRLGKFKHIINKFVAPIGCRDYDSASMYKNLGYEAYVNGCVTNTLPKRENKNQDKIYIINAPKSLYDYIPQDIKNKAIILTQTIDVGIDTETQYQLCVERYELLRDTASLVITHRYHVATPCAAMGIPVIMIENDDPNHHWTFDPRFPAMNPNIPFYTKEQWKDIDWDPKPAQFEDVKQTMIDLAISRIKNVVEIHNATARLNDFFSPNKRRFYDVFEKNKHKIDCFGFSFYLDNAFLSKIESNNFNFYLFGLSNRYIEADECLILDYVRKHYPQANFLGFADSFKKGNYFGKGVVHPNEMKMDANTYCLVTAYTANEHAGKLFEEKGFDKSHLWKMPEQALFFVYHL